MAGPLQRAFRAVGSWFGTNAGPYVDVGTNLPWPGDCEGVSSSRALSLPAVARGVAVYSDALASLPRRIVQRAETGGLVVDETSDAAHTLAALSYFDLEGVAASAVLTGNGFAQLARNARGGVEAFAWLDSARVTPLLDERGRLYYRVARDHALGERERLLSASDVVHLKFRAAGSVSRFLGVSPLQTCAASLLAAIGARQFQNEVLYNVKTPSVTLTAPGKISPDLATRMKTDWETNFGVGRRGRTAVLGEGLKAEVLNLSTAVDAQLDRQNEFGVCEVARALGIPVSLLMQPGAVAYGQAVEETRAFAALSLQPFAARLADELTAKLLTPLQRSLGFAIEFDLTRLLVSPGEVADRMSKLVNGGVLTPNEARNQLGEQDLQGGDALRVPVNTQPLERWLAGQPTAAQPPKNSETPDEVGDAIDVEDMAAGMTLRSVA